MKKCLPPSPNPLGYPQFCDLAIHEVISEFQSNFSDLLDWNKPCVTTNSRKLIESKIPSSSENLSHFLTLFIFEEHLLFVNRCNCSPATLKIWSMSSSSPSSCASIMCSLSREKCTTVRMTKNVQNGYIVGFQRCGLGFSQVAVYKYRILYTNTGCVYKYSIRWRMSRDWSDWWGPFWGVMCKVKWRSNVRWVG